MIVVRLLIPVAELDLFNSLVSPFEQEAYDILKCRSCEYKQEEPLAYNANMTHVFCITSWLAHCHCKAFHECITSTDLGDLGVPTFPEIN